MQHHREAVAVAIGVEPDSLELSMGMSGDFEAAVRAMAVFTATTTRILYRPFCLSAAGLSLVVWLLR